MNRLYAVVSLILAVVAISPAVAHDSDSCLPTKDPSTLVCHHFFEGQRIELPVRVALDAIDGDCGHLVVRVLQRQGMLLAQLGESLEFDRKDCKTMTSIALDLPDVRSETDVLLQMSLHSSRGGQKSELQTTVIALRVYPDTLLDPLARFAEQHALIVFDNEERLTGFFDRQQINYVRNFESASGERIGLLVQPKEPERMLDDNGIETAVIFREKLVDLPQVRAVSTHERTRVYVEMPFLHKLDSSPLAQKALLYIINLATNPHATDRG